MTTTKTEADLKGQVDRLNRNMGLNDPNNQYHIVHQYNMIYLFKNNGSQDISNGNTKTELYWQLVVTNKILEEYNQTKVKDLESEIEDLQQELPYESNYEDMRQDLD